MNAATMAPASPKDLLIGLLAELSLRGFDSIRISDYALHDAFNKALAVYRESGGELASLADTYYDDGITEANDELERAIIAAEGSGYLRFPNPTYRKLHLTIAPRAAQEILSRRPEFRDTFRRAADAIEPELNV
jgi:hypothetical protein